MSDSARPVVLVLLDGLSGEAPDHGGLSAARALPKLCARAKATMLAASGAVVGGVDGEPFATDLAYRAIGTGVPARRHVVSDGLADIGHAEPLDALIGIAQSNSGSVTDFMSLQERAKCRVHVFGLISDAPAQKSLAPLLAVLESLTDREIPVALHAILDGRDMPRKSAWRVLEDIVDFVGYRSRADVVGTVMGRAYALDATGDWDKTLAAYHAVVMEGPSEDDEEPRAATTVFEALSDAYEDGFHDLDLPPTRIGGFAGVTGQLACLFGSTQPEWEWNAEDLAVFALPSADEAAQLASVLTRHELPEHVAARLTLRGRKVRPFDAGSLVSLSRVPKRPDLRSMFASPEVPSLLTAAKAAGRSTLVVGDRSRGHAAAFALEGGHDRHDRVVDRKDAASALDAAKGAVSAGEADLVVVALGSVHHALVTGEIDALRGELEAIDGALDALAADLAARGGVLVVTSPHAQRVEPDADGHRGMMAGPVPLLVVGADATLRDGGSLIDVAPTVLEVAGVAQPEGMQGASLVVPAQA